MIRESGNRLSARIAVALSDSAGSFKRPRVTIAGCG